MHFEGELAVVIGRPCKDVPASRAAENILGYTIANDVSARDQQRKDGQWTRAKGHDTFCPIGPWIVTDLDPADVELRTEVNGETKQDSRTSLMIHESVRSWNGLRGDDTAARRPHPHRHTRGCRTDRGGDTVSISIEGVGTLSNPVVRKGKS